LLRQQMAQLAKTLQSDIPKRLADPRFWAQSDRLEKASPFDRARFKVM